MTEVPASRSYAPYMATFVSIVLALPLWRELREPGAVAWNVFLSSFLIAVILGVFFGIRYLQRNHVEVGEARFTPGQSGAD